MVRKHSNKSCGESWSHGLVSVLCLLSLSLSLSLSSSKSSPHTRTFSTLSLSLYGGFLGQKSDSVRSVVPELKGLNSPFPVRKAGGGGGVWLFPTPSWGATKFFGFLVVDMTTSLFTSRRPTAVNFNSRFAMPGVWLFPIPSWGAT